MIIDGRTVANHILAGLLTRVDELEKTYDIQPHLAVIRVGDDPAITSYITQKEKKAKEIGAFLSVYNLSESVTEKKIQESINFLQSKTDIHGLILQLPVPKHINYENLMLEIHPDKDVDGFRPHSPFTIPIASAILKLLETVYVKEMQKVEQEVARLGVLQEMPAVRSSNDAISGSEERTGLQTEPNNSTFREWFISKKIVVMGKGKTGGQPIIDLLKKQEAQVTIVDSSTVGRQHITLDADIIIAAVGKPNTLTPDMLKKDVILLGIGMSMNEEGKFVGDYNEEEIKDIASWYTPIPGGVGPVNVACLMENLVLAAENSVKN